jgi:hypothetical protein
MTDYDLIQTRKNYSSGRLLELKKRITQIDILSKMPELCIYVTGSYGRHEASEYSDLDLFFLHKGRLNNNKVSNINKTLLDSELIKLSQELKFPEFSEDGEYLQIHYLGDMIDDLGSRNDDFSNYFTARLLLILESYPLHNPETYMDIVSSITQTYFRDYHDHHSEFKPIFIANDIIRYWKTLCLNYEHKRNRPDSDPNRKIKNHIKNLKLKFSRLMTCFSMIYAVSRSKTTMNADELTKLITIPPIDRINTESNKDCPYVQSILKEYSWFLNCTGRPTKVLHDWISIEKNRADAFKHARDFGTSMYNLLLKAAGDSEAFRFLII